MNPDALAKSAELANGLSAAELAMAFSPCTIPELADEWWRLNLLIHEARSSRDHIEGILLDHSAKNHNGADEAWREGEVIEGKTVKVQAVWRLTDTFPVKWEPKLQKVREASRPKEE